MVAFQYPETPVSFREVIAPAHRDWWDALARPGTWWTGAERVAIAAETRRAEECALCRERKQALSIAGVSGEHDRGDVLPPPAVEAVHRVVTDASRLSSAWLQSLYNAGLTDAQYVELVGVATCVLSVDDTHRGLGLPVEPLPEPVPGEPSRRRPPGAEFEGAWVPTVPRGGFHPEDPDVYGGEDDPVPFIIRALSLVPEAGRASRRLANAQYLTRDEMRGGKGRTLSRAQIELIAARVSAINECYY
jgi:hypothetical protein